MLFLDTSMNCGLPLKYIENISNVQSCMMQCREYIRDGALKGSSPSEVVQSCDITFSCVSDQTALKDVSILYMNNMLFYPCLH